MQKQLTVWALNAAKQIINNTGEPLYNYEAGQFTFAVHLLDDSLWIIADWGDDTIAAFRAAFAPGGMTAGKVKQSDTGASLQLKATIGVISVDVDFPKALGTILHYKTTIKPANPLSVPFWPKDVLMFKKGDAFTGTDGELFIKQIGIRSGIVYPGVKQPGHGSFLYFQNLTSLNDYCSATETSAGNTVGGEWPEFGFSLPPTKEKPLLANKEFIISDAYISFKAETPEDQFQISTQFIDHLAAIYRLLPKPDTQYQDYADIIKRSIHDIENNKGCWSQHKGCSYLNAYVCDYDTPPEVMVQLAVLMPVWDYSEWAGVDLPFANQIYENIGNFYNEDLKTIKRWLPSAEDALDESEEQKVPNVMDSWYLHHPLLNLARMALAGDKKGKDLFLNSIEYAIKVAHHFDYKWPVFYDMQTLEVIKEETQPGMGGEKDVAGVYAQIMIQAYDITGEKRFLNEAEKAAKSMLQFGFDIFYQANNTAFSTKAMLRLYKDTGKKLYLDLCHLLIANLFKNIALWECNYGYGVNFPLFFGLFPLNDAPYLAVYEEQESFSSMHDLLEMAEGTDLSDNARLLLAEYIRHLINRAVFYFPTMLPKEMLSEETKTGEVDPKLWIALEDIHDGWEKAGVVGQEVYGAGLAFGIVPRHYIRITGQPFMVYLDYPSTSKLHGKNSLTINILGSAEMTCRMCIVPTDNDSGLPEFRITVANEEDKKNLQNMDMRLNPIEFTVHGGQTVIVKWLTK